MKKSLLLLTIGITLLSCEGFFNRDSGQTTTSQANIDPAEIDSVRTVIEEFSRPKDSIPNEYFTYFGFRDWYRWPLVYPYSLNSIDSRDDGFICDERSAKSISGSQDGIDQIYLGDIKKLTFNKEVLLTETAEMGDQKYKLFKFDDGEIINYSNLNDMWIASQKYGKMITDSLITMEHYNVFFR